MAERSSPLLEAHRFLRRGPVNAEGWSQLVAKDRDWERSYRGRWEHDKVVRSTHLRYPYVRGSLIEMFREARAPGGPGGGVGGDRR